MAGVHKPRRLHVAPKAVKLPNSHSGTLTGVLEQIRPPVPQGERKKKNEE
jgi:hypothetical protein